MPFYISYYVRHGSRYLLNTPQYNGPYSILKEADEKGVFTEFGKNVMNRLEIMKNDAEGRLGDLTAKGNIVKSQTEWERTIQPYSTKKLP